MDKFVTIFLETGKKGTLVFCDHFLVFSIFGENHIVLWVYEESQAVCYIFVSFEPRCEKTGLWGF